MEPPKIAKSLALASAVAALLVAPGPGAGASGQTGSGEVCADGSCCPAAAICAHDGHDHPGYDFSAGSCYPP
jgi:hypothetical protein